MRGGCEEYLGYEGGDVIFEIQVGEDKNKELLRKGSDLFMNKTISLKESLGYERILINIFGKENFYINRNKKIINQGETNTIIGKGFPFFDDNSKRGNFHIKFKVIIPEKLSEAQINIIGEVLDGNYKNYLNNYENKINIMNNRTNFSHIVENDIKNKKVNKRGNSSECTNKNNNYKNKKGEMNNKKNVKKYSLNTNFINNTNKNYNLNYKEKNSIFSSSKIPNENDNKSKIESYDLIDFNDSLLNEGYFFNK